MLRTLWNSKSAMMANQEKLDSISNNISNVGTDGYKKVDVRFKDLMYETLNRQGYPVTDNNGRSIDPYNGGGSRTTNGLRVFTQGNIRESGLNTDLAIDGDGFFKFTRPDGAIVYKRAGSFNIDADRETLVDDMGSYLHIEYDEGINPNKVGLENSKLKIDKDGIIYSNNANSRVRIGRIPLYNTVGDEALMSVGENYFVPVEGAQLVEAKDYDLRQGFVEMSNVEMSEEFTQLILTQRAFELNSRSLKTADEMWGLINNLRGR